MGQIAASALAERLPLSCKRETEYALRLLVRPGPCPCSACCACYQQQSSARPVRLFICLEQQSSISITCGLQPVATEVSIHYWIPLGPLACADVVYLCKAGSWGLFCKSESLLGYASAGPGRAECVCFSVVAVVRWDPSEMLADRTGGGGFGSLNQEEQQEVHSNKRRKTHHEQGYPRASGSISHWQASQVTA